MTCACGRPFAFSSLGDHGGTESLVAASPGGTDNLMDARLFEALRLRRCVENVRVGEEVPFCSPAELPFENCVVVHSLYRAGFLFWRGLPPRLTCLRCVASAMKHAHVKGRFIEGGKMFTLRRGGSR